MPKGRRGERDYDKEIEDIIRRFKKYPEARRSAGSEARWYEFLDSIGVQPQTYESDSGKVFWNRVRIASRPSGGGKYKKPLQRPSPQQIKEANVTEEMDIAFRNRKGQFANRDNPEARAYEIRRYFDNETNRQISRASVIAGRWNKPIERA